jgi:hypothetical protein
MNAITSLLETQYTLWLDLIDLLLMQLIIVPVYCYFCTSFLG